MMSMMAEVTVEVGVGKAEGGEGPGITERKKT
jgi:hypothetical protein